MSVQGRQPIIVNIAAQAITAGTPVALLTPNTGDKFRISAFNVSLTVAGSVIFKDGTVEFLRTPLLAAGIGSGQCTLVLGTDPGYKSTTAAHALQLDASASGSVSGYVIVYEE